MLKILPKTVETGIGGRRFYAVYGSPRNPLYGYIKPGLPVNKLKLFLTPSMATLRPKPVDVDVVVVGHTHAPMDIAVDGVRVVNSEAVDS